jgi:hypothetical protein
VKANQGAAGVDCQSIADFEADRSNNLYKLWNRLSSGSYFPPPVRRVEIPKANGGTRPLGIPTVADRIAQGCPSLSGTTSGAGVPESGEDAAGWGDKPTLGEPVLALRLRYVDGTELPSHPVRAILSALQASSMGSQVRMRPFSMQVAGRLAGRGCIVAS